MGITRREFLQIATLAAGVTAISPSALARNLTPENLFKFKSTGNITILHTTDTHAQLVPMFYREPDTNIGVGENRGKPPHITGKEFLGYFGFKPGTLESYAYTSDDFLNLAKKYGKVGGYTHIASIVKRIRAERDGKVLFIDGGDSLQGSATALWSRGEDMVRVMNKMGYDVMTGHWEFTYPEERVLELIRMMNFSFIAQNVHDATWGDSVFKPYVIKPVNGITVAIIGQAFPYTPIANPIRFIPNWSFGIKDDNMQKIVDEVRAMNVDLVIVISHNGFDVDKKMAGRVKGIDMIFGGHTHDGIPKPIPVGKTLVINSGCYGKFLSRMDIEVKGRKIIDYSFRLIPVMSELIDPDPDMSKLIEEIRGPHKSRLDEVIGHTEDVLYRRGNTDGTFDDLICESLIDYYDVEFAFSPGFRWGRTVLPGPITVDDIYSQTAITYANTYKTSIKGSMLKELLEDIADNIFNPDPYRQQGGDMVRSAGLNYTLKVNETMGKRIQDLKVRGKTVDHDKEYAMAGWAAMSEQSGMPVYDILIDYIKKKKVIKVKLERPKVAL